MKRISPFYFFAGLEILRYFALAWILEILLANYPPALLRFAAAPNFMFAAAFFFLALDPVKYTAYRPLILVGKTAAVFAAFVALPWLIGPGSKSLLAGMTVLAGLALLVLWDIIAALVLLFSPLPAVRSDSVPAAQAEPEIVEVD